MQVILKHDRHFLLRCVMLVSQALNPTEAVFDHEEESLAAAVYSHTTQWVILWSVRPTKRYLYP